MHISISHHNEFQLNLWMVQELHGEAMQTLCKISFIMVQHN
jgi:hypothetical protein